jgi:hypothetical protein
MHLLEIIAHGIGYLIVIGGAIAGAVKFGFFVFDEIQKRRQRAAQGYSIPPCPARYRPQGHPSPYVLSDSR